MGCPDDLARCLARCGRLARRSGRLVLATFLVLAGEGLLLPGGAWGQCVQDGTTVTCSGDVTDGFDRSGVNDLLVEVEANARVSIDGDDVSAMALGYDSYLNNGSIEGLGTITADGDNSRGVELGAGSSVYNYGTIKASGDGGIGVEVKAEVGRDNHTHPDGVYSVYNGHAGTITGGSGSGAAVRLGEPGVDHGSLVPLELLNRSEIVATGDGSAVVGSGGADTVINDVTGTITGPVFLWGGDDEFFNGGTMTGDVSLGNGADVFKNTYQGTITGDVDLGDGDDTFAVGGYQGSVGIIDGDINAGSGADTWELVSGPAAFDLSTIPGGFETVAIGTDDQLGGWRLSGSYTGELEVRNGFFSMDDDADLTGNLTYADGTELGVALNAGGAKGVLHVIGDVDIGQDTTLRVLMEDSQVVLPVGTYSILTWTGSRDGEFEEVAYPPHAGDGPLATYYSENSLLIVQLASYADAATTANGAAVGGYLDALADVPEFSDLFDALRGVQPGSSFDAEYAQLSAELYDTHTSAALSWGRAFTSVLKRRPLRCETRVYEGLPDVQSESPCGEKGWMPWAEPLGQYAKRDGGPNYVSYDRLGAGLAVGADKRLGDNWRVSASLAASRIGTDLYDLGNATLTTFDLGLAASFLFGPAHVRAVASYGHGWHSTRRDIDFLGIRATGDHDSNRLGLLLEGGYAFALGPVRIEPLVEFDYTYIGETAVSEEGYGPGPLRVDVRSSSQVATAAGLRVSGSYYKYTYLGDYLEWLDGVITPEVSARWRRVWTGADRDVEAHMAGAPAGSGEFTVFADDASAGLEIAARVRFQPQWTRNTVELGYDVFVGNDLTVHNLGATVRIPF